MEKLASGWRRHIQVTTPAVAAAAAAALAISLGACSSPVTTAKTLQATNSPSQSPQASAIAAIVRKGMKTYHLRAVIVRVTRGDKVVTTQAFGPSMTGFRPPRPCISATVPSPSRSEREVALHIPPKVTFYEEATYWNTAWGRLPGRTRPPTSTT